VWLVSGDVQLSKTATDMLIDPSNDLLISPATYWELAIKVSIGKYQLADPLADYI
jgi:PIN domain nuclease of toxin-antitoxin system